MDIELRPIRKDSIIDRENYLALQKSVALLPQLLSDNSQKVDNRSWEELLEHENRICYVIEKVPEHLYCGECAVKNICADVPEIEIELMKEYQNQGIGSRAVILMLNIMTKKYGKENYCARVEPDNYASQFLFEKLGGIPIGISRDYKVSDEREKQFIRQHRDLLDERIKKTAEKFGVEAELLLTHVLIYKINTGSLDLRKKDMVHSDDKKEKIDYSRKLSKEKYLDVMREWAENLTEILEMTQDGGEIDAKLDEKKNKLLNRLDKMEAAEYGDDHGWRAQRAITREE